jgi:hypothetical protein
MHLEVSRVRTNENEREEVKSSHQATHFQLTFPTVEKEQKITTRELRLTS